MSDLIEENEELEMDEQVISSPIVQLNEFASSQNVAELIDQERLQQIADDVIEQYENDADSMSDWSEPLDEVKNLNKIESKSKSQPWDGAANYKSNIIKDAVNRFGDRCSLEILNKKALCKAQVIGKDPDGSRAARGQRVCDYQNYDLRYNMKGWVDDQDKLFYQVAEFGSVFKKTYFDPMSGQNVSEVIKYPNFAVNQATTELDQSPFSIINQYTDRQIETKIRSGVWLDFAASIEDEDVTEEAVDSEDAFVEQHTFLDLDNDGYPEPYIATVYYRTRKVVRILSRYSIEDIIVKSNGAIMPLATLQYPDLNAEIVEIKPDNQITHYGFIPSTSGFLCHGYGHLLMSYAAGVNKTSNDLFNAGELSNLQGGYLAKGVRKKMGVDTFKPGMFKQTNIDPQDLKNSILPFSFKEPSQTLLSLREMLRGEAQESSSSVDLSKVMGNNTPAATALSVLQEQLMATSSIIGRLYRAMSEEFLKLYRLIFMYGDPEKYVQVINEPANMQQDFSYRDFDVVPVGNPELSSKMQRIMQAQAGIEQFERVSQVGGNAQELVVNYFKEIGVDEDTISRMFPEPPPHAIEQQNQLMMQQNQLAEQQNQLQGRLVATEENKNLLLMQKNEIQAMEAREKALKNRAEIEKLAADIKKTMADTVLTYEKAETEELNNKLNIYTAQLNVIDREINYLDSVISKGIESGIN